MIANLLAKRMYLSPIRQQLADINRGNGEGCLYFGRQGAHRQDLGS